MKFAKDKSLRTLASSAMIATYTTRLSLGRLLTFCVAVALLSCNKEVTELTKVPYTPSDLDVKAGSWKTYLLSAPDAVTVPAPAAPTSPEYKAELAALRQRTATLSLDQQQSVEYWGAGAVYRWHEIARTLCAKYNIAPAARADGTYPVPNADSTLRNPNYYPVFPFANPPYSARALSYLAVAQYDALVATWHYKYLYKRSAPTRYDTGLSSLLPVSELPSYPSEDAAVAAASFTVLVAMFPAERSFLQSQLEAHQAARLLAAANVPSDLAAGDALGKNVGAQALARARTDGMSAANNQALTKTMIADAQQRGLTQVWLSQELPARPPLLPTFGLVQPWNFDKAVTPTLRPSPPPAVGSEAFQKDLNELLDIAQKQTRAQARIANYWSDGPGSYTPPGHWNRRAADLCYAHQYSEVRTARTLALVSTALMDAGISCWDAKYYYYYPRPNQMSSRIKTSVGLPNFPSYTSGHSTFSAAAATVLSYIFPQEATEFSALAKEASESRIYGLIHYRFDCETGLEVGKKVGNYAVTRGRNDGSGL